MKGRNFSIEKQRWLYVLTDFVTTNIAFFLFNIFRYYFMYPFGMVNDNVFQYTLHGIVLIEQIFLPILMLGLYWLSGYYNSPFHKSRLNEFLTTLYTAIVASLLIFLVILINDRTGARRMDYEVIAVLFLLLLGFTYLGRNLLTNATVRKLKKRRWIYSTLIVGNSNKSREVYRKLKKSGSVWAYDVIGFIRLEREHQVKDDMAVWDMDDVEWVCRKFCVDQIIIATEYEKESTVMRLLDKLFKLNIPVKIAPDTISYVTSGIQLNDIMGMPLVDLTSPRISEFQKNVKRTFDVVASVLTMIFLSPVLLATAICVRATSKGGAVYSQERIGRGQKPFKIYKFRSMREDAESEGPQLSSETDSRVTPFGRFMRKYRIDELPQFWNVLKGDMSLVGPRPEREYYIRQIMKKAPYYCLIFQVRPGVTSWGMVKYGYAKTVDQMVKRSRFDLIYINNMSISTDLKIMIYTVRTVLLGKGM